MKAEYAESISPQIGFCIDFPFTTSDNRDATQIVCVYVFLGYVKAGAVGS